MGELTTPETKPAAPKSRQYELFTEFFASAQCGQHDVWEAESWVMINLYPGTIQEPAFSGSIFSDVLRVTRQAYIEDGRSTWAARLPVLLSMGVNQAYASGEPMVGRRCGQ